MSRNCFLIAIGVAIGLLCSCASKSPEFSLNGRAGEPCQSCEGCRGNLWGGCICKECTEFGYDAERKQLLDCVRDRWSVRQECPGGVSVRCSEGGGGYHVSCRDKDGNELP